MSNIFQEALTDAKKLKEVAEENAKKVILESVTPKIREFIEEQLLEDSSNKDNSIDNEEKEINEESILNLFEMIGAKDILDSLNENEKKDVISKSIQTAASKMSNVDKEKIEEIANKFYQNKEKLKSNKINNNIINQENYSMPKNEKYYEIDLQTLREAVEEEKEVLELAEMYEEDDGNEANEMDEEVMDELSYLFEQEEESEEESEEEDFESEAGEESEDTMISKDLVRDEIKELMAELGLDDDAPSDLPEDLPELEEIEPAEEESEELNEVFDVDPEMLRQELSNIRRQLKETKVDHQFGGKGEGKAGVDGSFGGKGKSNAGVKGSFGGGKEGQDAFTNPPQINKLSEAIRQLRRTNRSQIEKLNKYRSAVETLREQLEDLNLFNAKLLYVNKLLQNKALSESQKKSVIKALDEARSINETKALYKSLTESLASSKNNLNESTRFGSSSRVTTSSASTNKAVGELDRWQRLAGLKK